MCVCVVAMYIIGDCAPGAILECLCERGSEAASDMGGPPSARRLATASPKGGGLWRCSRRFRQGAVGGCAFRHRPQGLGFWVLGRVAGVVPATCLYAVYASKHEVARLA